MDGVHITLLKELDLRDSVLIDGFPSVGLVSSIVANYLVELLGLEQVGVVDSSQFPTVALVKGGLPLHPVRIYAGGQKNGGRTVVIFISEFQPAATMIKDIADAVLDWAEAKECSLLVCPEGLIVDQGAATKETVGVYGVGSTDATTAMLRESEVPIFEEGVITGVAGVLLNEGRKRGFDVISVLSEAHPDFPDARAAARVIETVDKVLLKMGLDTKPLYEEAGRIEQQLRSINRQALEGGPEPEQSRPTSMYG